jgi:glucose/arabinose dehydrogenase
MMALMSNTRSVLLGCLLLLTSVIAFGPGATSAGLAAPNQDVGIEAVTIQLQPVLSGLSSPLFLTNAHDTTDRLFIVEQGGTIKVLQHGATSPTTFLDITSRVLSGGERGLLGLAFHPQFASNRRFFVYYTRQTDGAIVIAEYHASVADPNVGDTTETVIIVIPHPTFANHNGGMVVFGPDGFLYFGTGDGGSGDDPGNNSQNINVLLGKILRIDIDHPNGSVPYSSPPSNPFFGSTPGADEIFAYGVRNPFRFSFDRDTGQLYVGDVGQGAREEVNIITLGGNYGWRIMEGSVCNPDLSGGVCTPPPGHIPPISEYTHSAGRCSITGGYIYRGARSSLPTGAYIFGDYCTGEIFMRQDGLNTSPVLLDTTLNISSFGEDESGEIYVVGLGGTVHRIVNPNAPPPQYQGFHDGAGCNTIQGWAWDSNNPSATVNVDIYDGNTFIAIAQANIYREDLLNALGSSSHGFSCPTPAALKDGAAHSIVVKFSGTNILLSNSNRTIQCSLSPSYWGRHDGEGCNAIEGWAWDANEPNGTVSVDIYDGTTLIGSTAATLYRQDLADVFGSPYHGFIFHTPASLRDGQPHTVTVKLGGTNTNLPLDTPRTFSCTSSTPNLQGSHDAADCNTISGYAWDANDDQGTINVAIYLDGNFMSVVPAQQAYPGIGTGYHGFRFAVPGSLKNGQAHSIQVRFSGTSTSLAGTPQTITCP